ncbi:hypothetical protein ECG_05779 [Echinococcus granulosus]|uniref:HTH_48 domain-containing protein n=1 Tax=Echinococcus granulosus TaxID=6210 RepID=A0A068WJT6_ECHGR|nr:hypothetical protein ECG_05779 [Echinococcus granulosus]CDS18705.1 hypothetical protein EgrG_000652200 [Echinococcus granulosus]
MYCSKATRGTDGQAVEKSDVVSPERELPNFGISGHSSSNVIAQRTCIKYFAHNGYTATKTLEIIQKAFGDHALSKTRVFH